MIMQAMNSKVDLEEIDSLFISVVNKLSLSMANFNESDRNINRVIKSIQSRKDEIPNKLNYERDAYAFNKAYFFKNLYKNLVSFSYLKGIGKEIPEPIVDIGSGAGTSTIAHFLINRYKSHLAILIDQNQDQLDIANLFMHELRYHGWQLKNKMVDEGLGKLIGTVVASYFFCEQNRSDFARVSQLLLDIFEKTLIVLDYPENINRFSRYINHEECVSTSWELEIPLSHESSFLLGEQTLHVHGCYVSR